MAFNFVQGQDYALAGSGCSLTDTSITLSSMTFPNSEANVVTADIGEVGYATLEPASSREENISFTGITQNGDGTATLTGVTRGLKFNADYTADTDLRTAHAGGALIRMTNSAPFYNEVAVKRNDEEISGAWTFDEEVTIPVLPVADTDAASKKYVDDTAIAGAPNATTTEKGIVQIATQAQLNAGTDTGSTGASVVPVPSNIALSVQNSKWSYAVDAQASDTYAITLAPAIAAYADGQMFAFKANTANTGAATLNVNGKGAITIKKNHDQDLETGDIEAGTILIVVYDSTGPVFQMQTQQSSMPTTALLQESATFFSITNMTGAQANTLVGGAASDAKSLHTHSDLLSPFSLTASPIPDANALRTNINATGYSDDSSAYVVAGGTYGSASAFQSFPFLPTVNVPVYGGSTNLTTAASGGFLQIGTAMWRSEGTTIYKASSTVTISGTAPAGDSPLGHDVTNSLLLVQDSSTRVRRYSGIAGTTITHTTDITLDNAVDTDKGFVYDNTNTNYYFIDGTVIRKFNSTGVTQSTTSIGTAAPSGLMGLCFINDRLHMITMSSLIKSDAAANESAYIFTFIPTSITR